MRVLVIYCYMTRHRVYTGDVLNDYIFRNIPMKSNVLTREKSLNFCQNSLKHNENIRF